MTRKVRSQVQAVTLIRASTGRHTHTHRRIHMSWLKRGSSNSKMPGLSDIRTSLAPSGRCERRLQFWFSCNTRLSSFVLKVIVFGGFDGSADHRSTEVNPGCILAVSVLLVLPDPGHRQHDLLHGSDNGWFSKHFLRPPSCWILLDAVCSNEA